MKQTTLTTISLICLVAFFSFAAGGITALKSHPIWDKIIDAQRMVASYSRVGMALPPLAYFPAAPEAIPGRYVALTPDRIMPGFLAITRLDKERRAYVTDLIDENGNSIHTWMIDYERITGGGDALTFPHGHKVLADASAVVNFDLAYALARIDACGQAIWTNEEGVFHHEISVSDGEYWTWLGPSGRVYDGNQLVRFDPETGEILERIGLVDDIFLASDHNRRRLSLGPDHVFNRGARLGEGQDDYHPNDIEPLPAQFDDAYPMFSPGDLLISLRNVNMIAVMDRQTRELKWSRQGPWIWQHDPDWHADGTISVFANNPSRTRSEIYVVDPQDGGVDAPIENGVRFFTNIMGTHERLPNGNWLIVASRTGRVIEVTESGDLVREFHNRINERYSAIVAHAEWLPVDYFETLPSCPSAD